MEIIEEKKKLRNLFRQKRIGLSETRKTEAKKSLIQNVLPLVKPFRCVLSFNSFHSEIDTHELNHELLGLGKLALPCVMNEEIISYTIEKMDHLISYGSMLEPDPKFHTQAQVDLVLVPGLAFDSTGMRLGWGMGHYDRFLLNKNFYTIGIGFNEQLFSKNLPFEKHDIKVEKIMLF